MTKPSRQNAPAVIGAIVLVGSEILAAALAAAWALAGMLKGNGWVLLALSVLCGGAALYATYVFARSALKVEPLW